jgi:hypothetical protein
MGRTVYFTICSKNYMAYALTLGQSLKTAEPASDFQIVLTDEVSPGEPAIDVEFPVIEARKLGIPTFADMAMRYSIMEFNTAVKAAAIRHLLDEPDINAVIYLDPDILILTPLTELHVLLEDRPSAILTPHACRPLDDGKSPSDRQLLRTGAYNLGFCAFTDRADSLAFLDWWHARLMTECRVDLAEGLFVDQKFMDLAPCYMDDVRLLKHRGYNAAYWNLAERPVAQTGDGVWHAGSEPLRFFHFSGIDPNDDTVFSRHQDRFTVSTIGDLADLLKTYCARLQDNGHTEWRARRYAYARLDDFWLDNFARRVYRRVNPEAQFSVSVTADELAAICKAPMYDGQLTRYSYEIWAARPDLRDVYNLASTAGRDAFIDWVHRHGKSEYQLVEDFLPPPRARTGIRGRLMGWLRRLR